MEKQGIKRFFKPVSTNSNVGKETNLVETIASGTQELRHTGIRQKVRKLKLLTKTKST